MPVNGAVDVLKLEAETERLSDLLGVMEEREEQLLEQLRHQEQARRRAEENMEQTQVTRLTRKHAGDNIGDKMKKVLLLTAAFGAVHSALQSDLTMGACNML